MNVLIVVDKLKSAIGRLAKDIKKYNPHWNIRIMAVHPKRPDEVELLSGGAKNLEWADLVYIKYWKSGDKLMEYFNLKDKKKILFHHNPYDILRYNRKWNDEYDRVLVSNKSQRADIPYATLIPLGVDTRFFKFNPDYTEEKAVNMTVARIEGKKGVLEVAQVCKELGYKFELVGRVSKGEYMNRVLEAGGDSITFHEDITDEKLKEIYYKSAIHVCNSVDNFETGTMPILESMLCGVPVLTRNVGHVPDLFNGKNMVIRKGKTEDVDDLKKELYDLMENRIRREKIRNVAWDTARNYGSRRMARKHSGVFYETLYDEPLVSVIMPTKDRGEKLAESIEGVLLQNYKALELVIADSGDVGVLDLIIQLRMHPDIKISIKYVPVPHAGYTLADARNRAVMEAEGEILVFCDDRLKMHPDAVGVLCNAVKMNAKSWVWGVKDGVQKGFVENFSAIRRRDFVKGGMCSNIITGYGGMTQELRTRFQAQDIKFIGITGADATSVVRTVGKDKRRDSIVEQKDKIFKLYG